MNSNKTREYEFNTWFDRFPIEIIFIIFDYLSSNDILYSFFDFNQRFKNVLIQPQRFLRSFQLPISNLDVWKQILANIGSTQIEILIISSNSLSLSLNYFKNLKSLIISSPNYFYFEQLKLILDSDQFKTLHSFKINNTFLHKIDQFIVNWKDEEYIFEKVFSNENILQILELKKTIIKSSIDVSKLRLNYNLRSLTLNSFYYKLLFYILPYAPNLEYLNVDIMTQTWAMEESKEYPDLSNIKLKELVLKINLSDDTHFTIGGEDSNQMINFIKQFSLSLKYLSLDLVEMRYWSMSNYFSPFNGFQLQHKLLESMIKLEQFQFYACMNHFILGDIDSILSTFQNQFYFNHNWIFGMHKDYLYTLPFPSKYLNDFTDFDQMKSTDNEFLNNNPHIWYNVTSIKLTKSCQIDSNLLKSIKIKMPNLTKITVNGSTHINRRNQFDITLNQVTAVHFQNRSMEDDEEWFIKTLPNLKHLTLYETRPPSPSSQLNQIIGRKIQMLDLIFECEMPELLEIYNFSNVEYVCIRVLLQEYYRWLEKCAKYVMYLFENIKKLKCLSIDVDRSFDEDGGSSYTTLVFLLAKLDLDEISKNFEMIHHVAYIEFSKKI